MYPEYVADLDTWCDPGVAPAVRRRADALGLAREDAWAPGEPVADPARVPRPRATRSRSTVGGELGEDELVRLFRARGRERERVLAAADALRREVNGDTVTYVVNRNINYTNVCYFRCGFCAFSKGKLAANLRGPAYLVPLDEIVRRSRGGVGARRDRGLPPGRHPPGVHGRVLPRRRARDPRRAAGAARARVLAARGLAGRGDARPPARRVPRRGCATPGSARCPGTAAEILDDEVRAVICPDKVTTAQWLEVMRTAHGVGLRTTSTIMFGHVESPRHWARHLLRLRELQRETGGFTEFVPLPFVHMEAPIALKGRARAGPTLRRDAARCTRSRGSRCIRGSRTCRPPG